MQPLTKAEPSLGDLLGTLSREVGTLVRQELQLAKVEVKVKAQTAASQLSLVAVGGAVAYAGLIILLIAAVLGLAVWMPVWMAALAVGAVAAIGGALVAMKGVAGLKQLDPAPRQTIETLRQDGAWMKEQLR